MSKSSPSSSLGENGPVRQVLISLPAPRVKAKIPLLAFLATKVPDFGYSSSIMHTRVGTIFKKPILPTNWLKIGLFEIVPTLMHTYSLLLPRRAKKPSRLEMGVLSNMSFAADSGSPFVVFSSTKILEERSLTSRCTFGKCIQRSQTTFIFSNIIFFFSNPLQHHAKVGIFSSHRVFRKIQI